MRKLVLLLSSMSAAVAQPVVAPSNAPVGPPRGQDVGDYNVVNSFETGYRFHSVGGNPGRYRSDVNFGNGLRLLGSTLTVNSKEGHGRWFDELILGTQGLGNDPYQFASVRVSKNRIYRYDMLWRLNDYYNPALTISSGQHLMDTVRTIQDHSLVLLPQSKFKLFAGFSRVNQNGPALSTVNWPDSRGDEFVLFTNVRRLQNELRLGGEVEAAGAKLSFMRTWEGFREDTRKTAGATAGNDPEDPTALNAFRRDEPYHGNAGSWRLNLLWDRVRWFSVNGRFTTLIARRNFIFDESATGATRFAAAANRQFLVFGDARRPVTNGALTISLFPKSRLTVVNHTAFHNTRMEGDGNYRELDNSTLSFALAHFQFLGIRTITNSTDVNFRANRILALFGGYQYSTRRIRSVEQTAFEGEPDRLAAEQDNTLKAARTGIRLQPVKPFTLLLDAEIGRADRPIYPISERNYHAIGGRVQYKTRSLFLSGAVRTNYNFNSVSLFSYSARSRNYSADASWTARPWLAIDASYSKLHLDTLSGLAYFYNRALTSDRSVYISNIHAGTLGVRFSAGSRAEVFAGYSRIEDTGGGRRPSGAAPATGAFGGSTVPGSLGYQVYPLTFDSPLARVSLRLHARLRWNAGYQHYRYGEQILPVQNYRAHTGFTSLTWSF